MALVRMRHSETADSGSCIFPVNVAVCAIGLHWKSVVAFVVGASYYFQSGRPSKVYWLIYGGTRDVSLVVLGTRGIVENVNFHLQQNKPIR